MWHSATTAHVHLYTLHISHSDSLILRQVPFRYSNYQNQHPIPNFVHNHVLRSALTDPIGDNITESTALGQTIDKHFSVVVPSNVANASNISFVAFVTDSNNTVVNSRAAAANENQSFEQNP